MRNIPVDISALTFVCVSAPRPIAYRATTIKKRERRAMAARAARDDLS